MTLQHLRSSTANKRPDPTAMADGQIALNTAAASPGLFYKDSAGNLVKAGPVHVGSTAPNVSPASGGTAGNSTGESWLDTSGSNPLLKVWNGSSWQTVQPVASGTVVSTADTGSVTSTMIADGTIVNSDVNASAAIAGTKISPDFGSQNVTTTGTVTGASLNPTSSTVPTNGVYLPAANSVAISTNSTGRLFVDSSGRVGVGTGGSAIQSALHVSKNGAEGFEFIPGDSANTNVVIYYNRSGTTWVTNEQWADSHIFRTQSTERLRITAAGLVGVGTSSPSEKLSINEGNIKLTSTDTFHYIALSNTSTGGRQWTLANAGASDPNGVTAGNLYLRDSTAGANRIAVDSSGRVGIGASSPGSLFSLSGSVSSNIGISLGGVADNITASRYIGICNSTNNTDLSAGSGFSGIEFGGPDSANEGYLAFHTHDKGVASGERLRIDKSGRIGIGTTPSATLDIAGSYARMSTSGQNANWELTDGTIKAIYGVSNVSSNTFFGSQTNHPVTFRVNNNEVARFDANARLLVGTSSAESNYYLTTNNYAPAVQIKGSSLTGGAMAITGTDGLAGLWLTNAQNVTTAQRELGIINFNGYDGTNYRAGASIQAVADATTGSGDMPGRLVLSVTQDGSASPTERMRIANAGTCAHFATNDTVLGANSSAASGNTVRLFSGSYNATAVFSGVESFRIWSSGDVNNQNNSYTGISDVKLKENIADASSQWDDIKSIRVRNYNLKEGSTHRQIGVIAQELETTCPGLVDELPDLDGLTTTKSVKYSVLYMKAVKALQEAMERIETLEAKVAALESA